jgi:predicted RNase H-like nuclease
VRFLGIDLGWQSGGSGVCCLEMTSNDLQFVQLHHCATREDVLRWIDQMAPGATPALVAVDAPTLIPNPSGMRLCDRLAHRHFGKYDAGCYPANQSRPFATNLIEFGLALEARGFAHAPVIQPQVPGRYQVELFPHPATIHLFRLPKILKYKKGRLAERSQALQQLRTLQLSHLPSLTPALPLQATDLPNIPKGGKAFKIVEDQLDSLTCAYAGAHWWWWGKARNWVLGDASSGYIVVPAPYGDQVFPTD